MVTWHVAIGGPIKKCHVAPPNGQVGRQFKISNEAHGDRTRDLVLQKPTVKQLANNSRLLRRPVESYLLRFIYNIAKYRSNRGLNLRPQACIYNKLPTRHEFYARIKLDGVVFKDHRSAIDQMGGDEWIWTHPHQPPNPTTYTYSGLFYKWPNIYLFTLNFANGFY